MEDLEAKRMEWEHSKIVNTMRSNGFYLTAKRLTKAFGKNAISEAEYIVKMKILIEEQEKIRK